MTGGMSASEVTRRKQVVGRVSRYICLCTHKMCVASFVWYSSRFFSPLPFPLSFVFRFLSFKLCLSALPLDRRMLYLF